MFEYNQEQLNQIMRSIAAGFQKSPRQIAIFTALILVFIAVLVYFAVSQTKKSRERRRQATQRRFESLLRERSLTAADRDVLERMSAYLVKESDKPRLLENDFTFDTAAERLRREGNVPDETIAALRLKLGFKIDSMERIPHSSTELPVGMPVVIGQKGKGRIGARIHKQDAYSLIVELDPGYESQPEKGMPVHVYFNNLSGIFGFSTILLGAKNGIVKLRHSENLKRIQRRQFYRKKLKLPVYVKAAGSEERPAASIFIDLGGGGASLVNPSSRFKADDKLYLTFFPTHDGAVNLIARVVRLSGKKKIMHVEFVSISDTNRDHIMSLLFRNTE